MNYIKYGGFKNSSTEELTITGMDKKYDLVIDKDSNEVMGIYLNSSTYPIYTENKNYHKVQSVYIPDLSINVEYGQKWLGEEGLKEKIENKITDRFKENNGTSLKDKIICSFIFDQIVSCSLNSKTPQAEIELKEILKKLNNLDKTGLSDFIDRKDNYYTLNNSLGINALWEIEGGINNKDLFVKVMDELLFDDLKNSVQFVALDKLNNLDDYLIEIVKDFKHGTTITEYLKGMDIEGLFVINDLKGNRDLIADSSTIIYRTDNGDVETIPMDGKPFIFNGNEYTADLNGLKLITIINYGNDVIIKDSLDGKEIPEMKNKNKNKLKI